MYLDASLMAHDCVGNTFLSVDDDFTLRIKASVDILENSPIFFNYVNALSVSTLYFLYMKLSYLFVITVFALVLFEWKFLWIVKYTFLKNSFKYKETNILKHLLSANHKGEINLFNGGWQVLLYKTFYEDPERSEKILTAC